MPQGETRAAMPSVTVVVVAHDPKEWFEDVLDSIVTQDYPRLNLLVIDHGSDPDLPDRVARTAPQASVVRAEGRTGFASAANVALSVGIESAYLLVCHDDVALSSNTVSVLVTEAMRSNAGVVGPKLVRWDTPEVLQHVGFRVDRFAVSDEMVEFGELDQSQYDAVTDVFAVPSACMLIRSQLFAALGGFDSGMNRRGEDIDFCWRAQLAGARVMVVPDARVRHRETLADRVGVDDVRRTRLRHQIRTVLVTGSRTLLPLALLQLALLSLGEMLIALATGRFRQVRDVAHAWRWNLLRLGEIRRRRRALHALQVLAYRDLRAAQENGSVRINAFVRGQIGWRQRDLRDDVPDLVRTGTTRFSVLVWVLVLAVVTFGSRSLIGSGVSAVGEFGPFPDQAGDLISAWWSGWRSRDLGSAGSTPTGFGLLGIAGMIPGVTLGLLRTAWVLGPVVIGFAGAWKLLAHSGSRRAQIGVLVAYAALPLPWVAIASGSWSGLAAYAVSPWVLRALLDADGLRGFGRGATRSWWAPALSAGTAIGIVGIFDPTVVGVLGLLAAGVLAGAFVTVSITGMARLLVATLGAVLVAATLMLPFTIDGLLAGEWWAPFSDGRSGAASQESASDILRFAVGNGDPSLLVWAFGFLAALPLLLARSWRFDLAVRFWFVALASWGLTLVAAQGLLPFGIPSPIVLLAPAAVAVAALCGTAVLAFERDVLARSGRGRRALLVVSLVVSVVAVLPGLARIEDGRWGLGRGGYDDTLPFADPDVVGSYRVLWIGEPSFLPAEGTALAGEMAWVSTLDGLPDVTERSVPADRGASNEIADAINMVLAGDGSRLGRVLGGLGIRYVVGVERLAPAPFSDPDDAVPLPAPLLQSLDSQLDLRYLSGVNSSVHVYENVEWVPVRAGVDQQFDSGRASVADLATQPILAAAPVMVSDGDIAESPVTAGAGVFVAQTSDPGWRLTVDSVTADSREAFGWARVYDTGAGGTAVLQYTTPIWRHLVAMIQVVLLVICASSFLRRRLRVGI